MAKISIKRFNNTSTYWQQLMNAEAYKDSIVFAKVWNSKTEKDLIIYAGKDANNGNEYLYKVVDFDRFIALENLVKIDDTSNFVNGNFQTALHNYIEREANTEGTFLHDVSTSIYWHDVDETN